MLVKKLLHLGNRVTALTQHQAVGPGIRAVKRNPGGWPQISVNHLVISGLELLHRHYRILTVSPVRSGGQISQFLETLLAGQDHIALLTVRKEVRFNLIAVQQVYGPLPHLSILLQSVDLLEL